MGNLLRVRAPKTTIDCLPTEILELVFLNLSSLKDVQNCFQVSVKWKTIIQKMFKDKGTYHSEITF